MKHVFSSSISHSIACIVAAAAVLPAHSQVIPGCTGGIEIMPPFDESYVAIDLGAVPGVPMPYGGLLIPPDSPNTLLIGGDSNFSNGAIYSIELVRDENYRIIGFHGTAQHYADAPFNDGGIVFGPDDVLFVAEYPTNNLSQIKPGSTSVDKVIDLAPFGVAHSIAGLNFPPFRGMEHIMKAVTWSGGHWYTISLRADGRGTFNVNSVTFEMTLPGGPEQFVYVPAGYRDFPGESILVAEWSAGIVSIYDQDANADPILSTRQEFITCFDGVEGAFIDPLTGDFLFSTWGLLDDHVVVVRTTKDICIGDLNDDDVVDVSDLLILLGAWGPCADPKDCPADLNNDGTVGVIDLLILLANWGPCGAPIVDLCHPDYTPRPGDPTPELYCDRDYRDNVTKPYMSAWVVQDLLQWLLIELGRPDLVNEIHQDTYVEASRAYGDTIGAGSNPLTLKVFLENSGKALMVQVLPDDYHLTHHPNLPPWELPTVKAFFEDEGTGQAVEFVFSGVLEILGKFSEHIKFLGTAYKVAKGIETASNPCTLWCALHHLSETPQSAGEWGFCVPPCNSFVNTVLSPLTFGNAGHAANIMRMVFYYECINLCDALWGAGYYSSNELHMMRSAIRFVRDSIPCQNPGCG